MFSRIAYVELRVVKFIGTKSRTMAVRSRERGVGSYQFCKIKKVLEMNGGEENGNVLNATEL
jgi:hypothetical protein